jgi:single-strand DNA-binding protein
MNKVILEGRLGRDPEVTYSAAGLKIASVGLATSNDYKDKTSGQFIKKPASWHNLVAFGEPAGSLAECKKGDIVNVEGKIEYNEWTNGEGKKQTRTKILCFGIEKKQSH